MPLDSVGVLHTSSRISSPDQKDFFTFPDDMLSWFSDGGLADSDSSRAKEMTAINSGIHEVPGVRLPLQTTYASPSPHAVFMYSSGGAEGSVTLQLRDADDLDDKSGGLASVLARLHQEDATLSISYQDADMLTEGSIDVLLGTGSLHTSGNGGSTATFDLFDSESGQDLTLSPQTFTSSTEAFINDNSDSLGVPGDTDTVGSTEDAKSAADSSKLAVKKPRPKASSPNRQGPQQCQVCGKVFGNASALAKHKLTHSDERKYVCSMCGKAFKRQDHLNGHMLTHRNKKPYECKADGCGKSYCDARSLRRHTENHHSGSTSAASSSGSSSGASSSTSTGDESSPLAASCIQYAPPPPPTSSSSSSSSSPQANSTANAPAPPPSYPTSTSSPSSTSTSSSTATPGSNKSPSQLQQLLATDPTAPSPNSSKTSSNSQTANNDGLTKQQLDLIHQIMQQTQQQAAAQQKQHQQSTSVKTGSSNSKATTATSKARSWTVQSPGGSKATAANGVGGGQSGATAASTGTASKPHHSHQQQQQQQQQDPKPVECNLCHRKFKNIPALNGHMRLHGGYFKKDSESKKCEKKEVSGPPLQTASMSVRALIEEKIIQKRITNPHLAVSHAQTTHQITYATADASGRSGAPLHYSVQSPGGSVPGKDPPDLNIKLSSFVVPAPPPQAEKTTRRHSDSEHFVSPRLPSGGGTTTEQEAVALAELLLKRSSGASKVAVKRASSDPGSHQNSNPNSASPSPQPQQQLQLSFQGSETYSLAGVGVSYQTDDGGYFSPSIQDDVFQQSVQDTMLLNGMDPAQLAETIQFQAASLLQDQTTAEQLQDIASLEDYQNATGMQDSVHSPGVGQYQSHSNHSIHQDFQAVLNSPLPVNLVDFSAYGQQSPIPKDLSYQPTHSPLDQKEFINYTNSPHTVLTNSPLPSPLAHHDSPSFTYPTPPASQEGQSPSFGHGGMITSNTGCGLPLSSPQQGSTDSFVQSVISHGGHVPPVSSPLSAAFYTTNMSSSAAVEEALSEVLPAESMSGQGCMRSHGLGLYQSLVNPSPPPHSPLSATPVPSPLSISSVPASSSSVSSPLPSSYAQTQGQISFPLSPHHTLQSQMMPNSEDPLLSSSPKDFCSRKKFDFGGIHSFKLLGNGMVDFGMANSGLTGIMVDSNGELKFFQAANSHPAKNMMVSGSVSTNISSASASMYQKRSEVDSNKLRLLSKVAGNHHNPHYHHHHHHNHHHHHSPRNQRPKLQVTLDNLKEEVDDDVFLSPTSIPASPIRVARKRSRPEPLYILPHPVPSYRSRLRAPRLQEPGSSSPPPQYTPPPMLSPARQGQGLFWQAVNVPHSASLSPATWPSSTTVSRNGTIESCGQEESSMPTETAPESDATPHINLGPDFQCVIPQWNPDREKANREPSYEHLLWDPGISKVSTDAEVDMYLEFACCAAVPGGGRNKEYALHLLHMCHGNIHEAMLKLMQPTPFLPSGHPLLAYDYCESDRWSADEMDSFHQGLLKHDKDFLSIAQEIGSKTIKQCIQFYYLWKKVCPEEYKRLRLIRRRQNADYDFDDIKMEEPRYSIPANDVELVSTSSETRLFVCEYPDCSASFNSRAALNGHIRIHGGGVCGRSPTPDKRPATATPPALGDLLEEFPCKICGKVFNKVKSRSAHMKSHRPPDAEPKKPKLDPHKMEAAEQTLGRAMCVSSTIGGGGGRHP